MYIRTQRALAVGVSVCKDSWYHDNYCLVILKDFYEEDLYVKDE